MSPPLPEAWQAMLEAAVAPLNQGVSSLRVYGPEPDADRLQRPGRTAAVLVGILDQANPEVLLTVRARHLAQHPGQVCFPGGQAEEHRETGVLTALREAEEEIGLRPDAVQPIGFLDRLDTISDFRVLPVVGLVRDGGPWRPDRREVEEVFTLPLEWALDLSVYERRQIERSGTLHEVFSAQWQGRTIWGITAAILVNLAWRAGRAKPQP